MHAPWCFREDRRDLPPGAVLVGNARGIAAGAYEHEADGFGKNAIKIGLPRSPRLRELRHK